MKKVKVLVVENEILVGRGIQLQLNDLGYEICPIVNKGEDVLRNFIIHQPDIVLMDINLDGKIDGIEAAKKLNIDYEVPIIYLTDLKDNDTFERAKKTVPAMYLNKPFNENELSRHIELAIYKMSNEEENSDINNSSTILGDFVWVKDGLAFKKISIQEILWIKAGGSSCELKTNDSQHILSKNMRIVNELINDASFIRVHKSFIINSKYIEEIRASSLLINQYEIPIGKTYLQSIKQNLKLL